MLLDKFCYMFYTTTMKNKTDKIMEEILRKINPNLAADRRKFTKAARHCGLSRKQLERIYMYGWVWGIDRVKFADMILQGRLIYCKDARGDFYSPEGRNWYQRKNGEIYYFTGQYKGKILKDGKLV